jgi:hypothetical protein
MFFKSTALIVEAKQSYVSDFGDPKLQSSSGDKLRV